MVVAIAGLSSAAAAADLHVPGDYRDIDAAVTVAKPGDRIVLRGRAPGWGRLDSITLHLPDDVTIQGGRISSDLTIHGDGLTLRGVAFRRGMLSVFGDRARLQRCRVKGTTIRIVGSDARVVGNRTRACTASLDVIGDDARVERNRFHRQYVHMNGDRVEFVDNRAIQSGVAITGDDAVIARNRERTLQGYTIYGDRALFDENHVRRSGTPALRIWGAEGCVRRNRIERVPTALEVRSGGSGPEVLDNDFVSGAGICASAEAHIEPVVSVSAAHGGTAICENRIVQYEGSGIVVTAHAALVENNRISGRNSSTSVRVIGDDVEIVGNDITQRGHGHSIFEGHGIDVLGHDAAVTHNGIANANAHGIVIEGTDGVVGANLVRGSAGHGVALVGDGHCVEHSTITGSGIDGIVAYAEDVDVLGTDIRGSGRFGICFEPGATGGHVEGTDIRGSSRGGLLNAAAGTTIVDTTLRDNAPADLLVVEPLGEVDNLRSQRTSADASLVPTGTDGWFEQRLGAGIAPAGRTIVFGHLNATRFLLSEDRVITNSDRTLAYGQLSEELFDAIWSHVDEHDLAAEHSGRSDARDRRYVRLWTSIGPRSHLVANTDVPAAIELYTMLEAALDSL